MNSENMLLGLYKKQQYDSTRNNIQKLVIYSSAGGMLIGAVLSAVLLSEPVSMYLFASVVVCIIVAYLLQFFKVVSLNTATLIYFTYLCFIFVPVNWYFTDGLVGATPYIAVIIMLAIMIVFTGKTLKIIHIIYLAMLFILLVYSAITTPVLADMLLIIYKSVAFFVAIVLIAFYMMFMLKKYDQMHNMFLNGSIRDELTRMLNRSVLDVVIEYVETFYQSKQMDYVMIMIDVDNFKKLNDEYGHVVGDIVLRNTAECIREHMREEDFVIRYGGDEFLVVLLGASTENAKRIFERVENEQKCRSLLDFNITVSRGYAERSECKTPKEVIELADKRMYENKESKRVKR